MLANWSAILGLFVVCDCVTTQALSFATPFAALSLELGAVLSMNVGATVRAIVITNSNNVLIRSVGGPLNNTNASGVPVIYLNAGATATFNLTSFAAFPFLTTGSEVGGAVGSAISWGRDDTVDALLSSLMLGTITDGQNSTPALWQIDLVRDCGADPTGVSGCDAGPQPSRGPSLDAGVHVAHRLSRRLFDAQVHRSARRLRRPIGSHPVDLFEQGHFGRGRGLWRCQRLLLLRVFRSQHRKLQSGVDP